VSFNIFRRKKIDKELLEEICFLLVFVLFEYLLDLGFSLRTSTGPYRGTGKPAALRIRDGNGR
jgi:hypothetical protein